MSYANMVMYGAVLPSWNAPSDKKKDKREQVINADDPKNRELVNKLLGR